LSKKILYITQYYPPEVGAGAVRAHSIVSKFEQQGWKVDVVCEIPNYPLGERYSDYKKGSFFSEKFSENVTIYRIWVWITKRSNFKEQMLFFLSFMLSVLFFYFKNQKKYDIIYCSSPPIFSGISALVINRLIKNSKFVFEVRDLWPDSAKEALTTKPPIFIKIGYWIEKKLYTAADLVIAVTEEAKINIQKKSPNTTLEVIHNGVNTDQFKPIKKNEIQLDEKLDLTKFTVGYVGSLGVIHDLRTFLLAAKKFEDDIHIQFIIVGDGGQKNELKSLINEINPKNFIWVGLKEYIKIPHYISSFDVAINPMNNFPAFDSVITVKFYEYLACGVPVITSDLKSMKEIAQKSESSITYKTGNSDDLADKILLLKNNPHKLNQLSKNCTLFIKRNYDRKKVEDKLIHHLKMLF
jgi:glycosyltransferase involved in cell wall biosynthesis